MPAALIALFLAAGAWVAWQRNPSYSSRSGWRSVLFTLLAIGAFAGLLIAAVNLTGHRSPAVFFSTMGVLVVFGTLSLIFIIQSVSTSKAAKLDTALPPSAKLVHIYRQRVYKWAKIFALVLAVCGILAAFIPTTAGLILLAFDAITLLVAVVLLPVMYVSARTFDRSLTILQATPWVHWQYTPEQWNQWTEFRVQRLQARPVSKPHWRWVAGSIALLAVLIFIFYPGEWLSGGLFVLGCGGAVVALVAWIGRANQRAPEKLRAVLRKAAPEVYFGHDGLFADGIYLTWLTVDVYLLAASMDKGQPHSMNFSFEKVMPDPYGGPQVLPIFQSILIPAGTESDIARLQHELTVRCPKARITLC